MVWGTAGGGGVQWAAASPPQDRHVQLSAEQASVQERGLDRSHVRVVRAGPSVAGTRASGGQGEGGARQSLPLTRGGRSAGPVFRWLKPRTHSLPFWCFSVCDLLFAVTGSPPFG